MRFKYKKLALIGLVCGMTFASACSSKKVSKSSPAVNPATAGNGEDAQAAEGGSESLADETEENVNPNDLVAVLSAGVGLLNFRQVAATYQQLTGVTLATAPEVLTEYTTQQPSLPNDAAPAAISASKVAAATKLAARYCDVLSTNAALFSARFPNLNLTAVPADSSAFAKSLLDGFYGSEHMLQGPRATDIASVAATVDALKGMAGATGPTIFMATCAAVMASAEFFVY